MVAREVDLRREARQRRRGRSEEAAAEVEGEQEESSASATFASIALAGAEPRQGVAVACVVGMPMGPTGLAASARQQAYSGRTGFRLGSFHIGPKLIISSTYEAERNWSQIFYITMLVHGFRLP